MSWFYRRLLRPALFAQSAEQIHDRTMHLLGWAGRHPLACQGLAALFAAPELPVQAFGLRFPNPVGLAAGMDKHAAALPTWAALGFGFTELGAVTWHPQPGNPPPRVFRAIPERAIVNRMGFNNPGAEALAAELARWRARGLWPNHPVGINLGKSKITPLDQAAGDYAQSFRLLLPYLDFFVVNVSSPNTPNLRQLQDKAALDEILAALQEVQSPKSKLKSRAEGVQSPKSKVQSPESGRGGRVVEDGSGGGQTELAGALSVGPAPQLTRPVLVKVAPDLSFEALDEILELVGPRQIAGIVATNTTIARPETNDPRVRRVYDQTGGLSGAPLRARSTEVIRHLYRQTRGTLPIIGVGGIFDAADAWEKIIAGACLVQIYTGMVYEGPGIARAVVNGLRRRVASAGLTNLSQATGSAWPRPKSRV